MYTNITLMINYSTKYIILALTYISFFIACQNETKKKIISCVKKLTGKQILFPVNSIFTIDSTDTIDFSFNEANYKIVSYIDTTGCTTCKLKSTYWICFMDEIKSAIGKNIPFIFYLVTTNRKDLLHVFLQEGFEYPVCIDETDEFNRLNKLPANENLHTFLLEKLREKFN